MSIEICEEAKVVDNMKLALQQAQLALEENEIPCGCVFVHRKSNQVVAEGRNKTNGIVIYKYNTY